MTTNRITLADYAEYQRCQREGKKWAGPFARATPTVVDDIRFPSKTQAKVYARLREAVAGKGFLYREIRFPLLNHAPNEAGKPDVFTLDFVVVWDRAARAYVDAKAGKTRNREWSRGKHAFEAEYRCKVIEWDGVGSIPDSILNPHGVPIP